MQVASSRMLPYRLPKRAANMKYVDVCSADAIPENTTRPVRVAGIDMLLCNVAGDIHAIENDCLHRGAALNGGRLDGRIISCPVHGWRYDVATGELCAAPEMKLRTFKVSRQENRIAVLTDGHSASHSQE